MRYLEILASYVPSLVVRHLLDDPDVTLPCRMKLETVCMFCDVSGFTKLTEKLALNGEGAEGLKTKLNSFFGQLNRVVGGHGGDIFKFAGDAVIVLWPDDEPLEVIARRACRCALECQAALHSESGELNVKIGLGVGPCATLHVGGSAKRAECVAVGQPLSQAFAAEARASSGDVILSKECWRFVRSHFSSTVVGEGFVKLMHSKAASMHQRGLSRSLQKRLEHASPLVAERLEAYVPRAVLASIKSRSGGRDAERWAGETVRCCCAFVDLGLNSATLLHAMTDDGALERVHAAFACAQQAVYEFEGAINKFLHDDKGSTLIACWGLPPYASADDAERAVFAALRAAHLLTELGLRPAIGVTLGDAYCGVTGSVQRREYTVLGDSINLAARLMARKQGVLVDATIAQASSLAFEALGEVQVKGRQAPVGLFRPHFGDEPYAHALARQRARPLVDEDRVCVIQEASQRRPSQNRCMCASVDVEACATPSVESIHVQRCRQLWRALEGCEFGAESRDRLKRRGLELKVAAFGGGRVIVEHGSAPWAPRLDLDLTNCATVRDLRIRAHAAAVKTPHSNRWTPRSTRASFSQKSPFHRALKTASPRMPFFFRTPKSTESARSESFFAGEPPKGPQDFVLKVRGCRCWLPDDLRLDEVLGFIAAQLEVTEDELRAPLDAPHAWPAGGGCARLALVLKTHVFNVASRAARLREALYRARLGGGLVVVEGDAGQGKSRRLRAFARSAAAAGLIVNRVTCSKETVLDFTGDVLIVDDAQHLDASGWRALLKCRAEARKSVVVVATRPLRTWPPWRAEALNEAQRVLEGGSLTLDGLPREEIDLIVAAKIAAEVHPAFGDALHCYARGNPFIVADLVDALAEKGDLVRANGVVAFIGDDFPLPEKTRNAMTERLNGLDAAAVVALKAACVAGRPVLRRDLVECHGVAEGSRAARDLRAGVRALEKAGLLVLIDEDLVEVAHGAPMHLTCKRRTLVTDAALMSDRLVRLEARSRLARSPSSASSLSVSDAADTGVLREGPLLVLKRRSAARKVQRFAMSQPGNSFRLRHAVLTPDAMMVYGTAQDFVEGLPPKVELVTPFDVFSEQSGGALRLAKAGRRDVLCASPDRVALEEWRLMLRGISDVSRPAPAPELPPPPVAEDRVRVVARLVSVQDLVNPVVVAPPLVVSCTVSLRDVNQMSSTKLYANGKATWDDTLTFDVARADADELRLTVRDHRPFAAPDVVGTATYDLRDVDATERWVPLSPAMDGFSTGGSRVSLAVRAERLLPGDSARAATTCGVGVSPPPTPPRLPPRPLRACNHTPPIALRVGAS